MSYRIANFDDNLFANLTFGVDSDPSTESKDDRRNQNYWKRGSMSFWSDQTFGVGDDSEFTDEDQSFFEEVVQRADNGLSKRDIPELRGLAHESFEKRIQGEWLLGEGCEEMPWDYAGSRSRYSASLYFQGSGKWINDEIENRIRVSFAFTVPAEKPSQLPDDEELFAPAREHLDEIFEAARAALIDAYRSLVKRYNRKERQERANRITGHYIKTCYEEADEEDGFAEEIDELKQQIADLKERRDEAAQERAIEAIEADWEAYLDEDNDEAMHTDELTLRAAREVLCDDEQFDRKPLGTSGGFPGRRGSFGGSRVEMERVVEMEDDE